MTTAPPARRLYRSRTDRMLGGVAGGVAAYFEVDPVLVRFAFVALLFTGVGLLAYVIAWVVVPEEPLAAAAAASAPAAAPTPAPARRGSPAGRGARLAAGTVLVAIGVILLLDWAIPDLDHVLWPGVLIACGLALFTYGVRR